MAFAALAASAQSAAIAFRYPVNPAGALIPSAWVQPDGSDSDIHSYEKFTVGQTVSITDVDWTGGYIMGAPYGHAFDFSVTFYASTNENGLYPLVSLPDTEEALALAQHAAGSTAGETPIGGGRYAYHFTLPEPFVAQPGQTYWMRIEAYQHTYPDWGVASGTGGNASHVQYSTGTTMFTNRSGDVAFTLSTTIGPTCAISVEASPPEGGTVAGAEVYAPGAAASVLASANPGFDFVAWTEADQSVATSAAYAFTATADRDLVAVFAAKSPPESAWALY